MRKFSDDKEDYARVEKSLKELIIAISVIFHRTNTTGVAKDVEDLLEFEKKLDEVSVQKKIRIQIVTIPFIFRTNESSKCSGNNLTRKSKIKTVDL